MGWRVIQGDCREVLRTLPEESVQCCVTSPPYWGLRDYGHDAQVGMEVSLEEYVSEIVGVFRAVRRVLRADGTLWLNLGDSFCSRGGAGGTMSASGLMAGRERSVMPRPEARDPEKFGRWNRDWGGAKPKDMLGVPWCVAFALRADGWWLRSDIIWHKPNPMPESVEDRPTKSHEYVFLIAKSESYFYDKDAVSSPTKNAGRVIDLTGDQKANRAGPVRQRTLPHGRKITVAGTRNCRSVWTIQTRPFSGAHFAVMPCALVEPCVLAGSRVGDTILDPFCGSGTVGLVARRHGRDFVGIELNPEYAEMARARVLGDAPLFNAQGNAS